MAEEAKPTTSGASSKASQEQEVTRHEVTPETATRGGEMSLEERMHVLEQRLAAYEPEPVEVDPIVPPLTEAARLSIIPRDEKAMEDMSLQDAVGKLNPDDMEEDDEAVDFAVRGQHVIVVTAKGRKLVGDMDGKRAKK